MKSELRKTGIDLIGNASWGTHFCQFYQSKEDLLDILIPYFKAGLENNEFCMWVTSSPLVVEEAVTNLRKAVKNLDDYVKNGQIEILDYKQWYTNGGKFDAKEVLDGWVEKHNQALERGFDGLRLTGNIFWLEDKDWRSFVDYEEMVNNAIGNYKILAFCCYSLDKCGAHEILDVVSNHKFALIKREAKWQTVESSDHKKAEKEIKSLAKFPSENPNPVLRVKNNGSILYTNNAGTILLDYWGTQTNQSVPEDWHKHVLAVLRSGKSKDCEIKYNGNIFSITLTPVVEEGYVNFYGHDITKRKKMEEMLLQSEKLKSLGTITAGISHEFNNILAIISGNVQLLQSSYKDHEELSDALRTIRRMTDDGAEISRRMLQFTKTAKDTAGFVPFDINKLINEAIDFTMPRWKNMAQAKGINYHMATEGMKRVPSILCNPTELREVFVNIINNALDAMPDDGRITFHTWNGEDTVFINISDTGEGMPEEVKKNIFDPFFTTKIAVGAGLGMSTAYGIVTAHGGNIEVESEVGKGTTFTLQFPIAAKANSPKESPEPKQKTESNSLCILVVDDEEDICNILDKFLSKRGHLVRTVDNGRGAIILSRATDFDLVLCDIAMPNIYGYDVIRALNELEKRPKIGIITGWGEKLKSIDDEDMKVDFIIKKPFDLSELTKNINEAFKGSGPA